MSNQFFNNQAHDLNQQQTLEHFNNLLDSIYTTYQNTIPALAKLSTVINHHKKFANLVNDIIYNTKYDYKGQKYANFNLLINEAIREFQFKEQLYIINHIDLYGVTHNDKTTELLKWFMAKILREKLIKQSSN